MIFSQLFDLKKLDKQVCFLSSFAMILVVLGHSEITDDYRDLFIVKWLNGFHMALFMFVSGYLYRLTNPKERIAQTSFGGQILKKAKRLLIPYFFWSAVFFLIKATLVNQNQMKHPTEFTWDSFFYFFFQTPIGFLWFLPALFFIFVIVIPLIKLAYCRTNFCHTYILYVYCVAFAILFYLNIVPNIFQLPSSIRFMPFFIAGFIYREKKEKIDCFLLKYAEFVFIISLFLSLMLIQYRELYLTQFAGIVFCLIVSLLIGSQIRLETVMFSKFTYTIFLISYIPQMIVRGPLGHAICINQYFLSCLSFLMGLLVPVFVGYIVLYLDNLYKNNYTRLSKIIFGL